jgi:hypothetical protein
LKTLARFRLGADAGAIAIRAIIDCGNSRSATIRDLPDEVIRSLPDRRAM